MINSDDNNPWYPYYVQQIIENNLNKGDNLVDSSSSSSDVRVISWINQGKTKILVICKVDQPCVVHFEGIEGELSIIKIDATIPWTSPSVQFEEIDSSNPLELPGYAIALVSVTA